MAWNFSFNATGTHWKIDIFDAVPESAVDAAAQHAKIEQEVRARIEQFEQHYSRFRPDSLLSTMSRLPGDYILPTDAKPLFDIYHELYKMTSGLFTPLIGQVLVDAGYDPQYSLTPKTLSQPPRWEDILEYQFPRLTMKKGAQLDVGAAGKGYAVDLVAGLLKAAGCARFCVDAGGDMFYFDQNNQALEIGLEHPDSPTEVIGIAQITNQSIAGSSGNRRRWAQFHHTINPQTLTSPEEIRAIWVIASSALIADALTTCLFLMQPEEILPQLIQRYRFEYCILYADYSINISEQFPATFFS